MRHGLRLLLGVALIVTFTCSSLVLPHSASAKDSTLREYRARVGQAHELVVTAADEASLTDAEARELSEDVTTLLPPTERVSMDEREVVVDNSVLTSLALRLASDLAPSERASVLEDMEDHLAALVSSAGEPGKAVPADQEALDGLLSEQQIQQRNPISEWFAKVVERIGEFLLNWWDTTGNAPGVSSTLRAVTYTVLALLLAGLIWMLVRVIMYLRSGTSKRAARPRLANELAIVEAAQDLPEDALAHADALASGLQWRDAVRALFGGAARELVAAGYVLEAHRRTNGELLLEIKPAAPHVYGPVAKLCASFERAWYGHHDPGPAGFADARVLYEQVLVKLAAPPSPGGDRA